VNERRSGLPADWGEFLVAGVGGERRIGYSGLLAAVSRIAAILPNDLAPTNMNGPDQPFDPSTSAAVQLSHSCHSCIAQHFRNPNDGSAGLTCRLTFLLKGQKSAPMQTLRRSTVPQYSIPVTVFENKRSHKG